MTWLALTLSLVAGAGPAVDVVERNTVGLSPAAAAQVRERLRRLLVEEGLDATASAESCADAACLRQLAGERGRCVLGVTVVKSRKGLTLDLEAVEAGRVVLQQTLAVSPERLERAPETQRFARQLRERLTPADAPLATPTERPLEPALDTTPPTLALADTPAEAAPSAGPRLLLGASAAVAVAGAVLLIAGAASAGSLDQQLQAPVVTGLNRAQAQAWADGANALMGGGAAATAVGLGGVLTSVVLLAAEPAPDEGARR